MPLNGVKDNKCFEPIDGLTAKYQASQTQTIPTGRTWANGAAAIMFSDDSILPSDTVIITLADGDTGNPSYMQTGVIEERHAVMEGGVVVYIANTDTEGHTLTINCMVL